MTFWLHMAAELFWGLAAYPLSVLVAFGFTDPFVYAVLRREHHADRSWEIIRGGRPR